MEINPNAECCSGYTHIIEANLDRLIEGDFACFGCYNGIDTAKYAAFGRQVWAFDTFEGMPDRDYIDILDRDNPPGKFAPQHDVIGYLNTFPNIRVLKGRFLDTLPQIPAGTVFSMVYLDCDYYNSHVQVLNYLQELGHIVPSTLLIFDDYNNLLGARKAIDEWKGSMQLKGDERWLLFDPSLQSV